MRFADRYNEWLLFDDETKQELLKITDEKELEDRFYKDLAFGTGGLRGIMGAGPNRMNVYTVSKATAGLAQYLNDRFPGEKHVVIAYDSRNHSRAFAECAAQVLAAKGITAHLFREITPTPVLSFAVRYLHAAAGIVITASHNPKEYNGYKVYDANGCQLVPALADEVIRYVDAVTDLRRIDRLDFEVAKSSGLVRFVSPKVLDAFLDAVRAQSVYTESTDLKVVYTPLHGTGNIPVRRILERYDVSVLKSQEQPDGDFSTVRSPNPEERDALTLAIEQARAQGADLVLGTDPDCDRVGIAVRHDGDYVQLTGNQVGALLTDFLLRFQRDTLKPGATLVKTIVTNDLGADIARRYGLSVVETLTGFKFIGEQITKFEESGDRYFVFGYEESYGYLAGTYARDKDAVVASMLICEMAAYHKAGGRTLVDALESLYADYGCYLDALETYTLRGEDGAARIRAIMQAFRKAGASAFSDVKAVEDFAEGVGELPKSDVLKFRFEDGGWLAIRPSGTEPKLKVYFSVCAKERASAEEKLARLQAAFQEAIGA